MRQRHLERLAFTAAACSCILAAGLIQAKAEVKLSATKAQVQTHTGTDKVKMVWSNQDALYFVDYSQPAPTIKKLVKTAGAVAPTISPDGNYVTYATGVTSDGRTSAKSSAWIAELNENATPVLICADSGYNPRFVQNATVPTVLYSTCGSIAPPDSFAWRCGRTVKREFRNNTAGPEQIVLSKGSYFGGLSYDGRYLCTAEQQRNCWMLDLQNASAGPHYLFWLKFKNKTTGVDTMINPQVCNSSISASRMFPDVMMHLSFNFNLSNYESTRYENRWGMHDRFVLSNYAGDVVRYYMQPTDIQLVADAKGVGDADLTEVDDPEWSNHPYFASANLLVQRQYLRPGWTQKKRHELLYIFNLKAQNYLRVVESTDTSYACTDNLQWPWVWIEIPAGFQEEQWLTSATSRPLGVAGASDAPLSFDGNRVVSAVPIERIVVYTLLGQMVTSITPDRLDATTVDLGISGLTSGGLFFVSVELRTGVRQVLRYTAGRR